MKIDIFKMVGQNCVTVEDGSKVFDVVHPELAASRKVEIDFNHAKVFASPFFNAAFGRLLKDFSPTLLNSNLKIEHLSDVGKEILRRVIENAKDYYNNPATRKALDDILKEQSSGNDPK